MFRRLLPLDAAGPRSSCEPALQPPRRIVVLVERGEAMIATRLNHAFFYLKGAAGRKPGRSLKILQESSDDQRQWLAPGGGPSSTVERIGAIHEGLVIRKSQRAGLAGTATAAPGDQYPDQRQRQQHCRE